MRQLIITVLGGFLISSVMAGCTGHTRLSGDVIQKLPAPKGDVTAIETRYDGGATVPFSYSVYISWPGDKSRPYKVFVADHQSGLRVKWANDTTLVISMECGRIFKYSNFADIIDYRGGALKKVITIKLHVATGGLCPS